MKQIKRYAFLKDYDASHPIFQYYTTKNSVNYHGQKSMAKKRGIDWEFTLYGWIEWWVNSGHFHERGVGNNGYQMCRFNDVGEYSPTNTYCATGYENINSSKNSRIPMTAINTITGEHSYYDSMHSMCNELKMDRRGLVACLSGVRKTLKGHRFEYKK